MNLPWYVAIYLREPQFLKHFFWEHNVMRFLQPFDHLQPIWYYVPILVGGLLPGTILLAAYLWNLVRGSPGAETKPSAAGGFWLLAGGWCVFFFSCSGSKLPTYILPAYPFLCLAVGEFVARTRWNTAFRTRALVGAMAALMLLAHYVAVPWYAKERSPVGRPELVDRFVNDPKVAVVCFPRNCDSLAFYADRSDMKNVRTKSVNQLIMDCHHRPRTVILFTHRDSLTGFKNTLPPSLEIVETTTLKRKGHGSWLDKLSGSTPWGLCDIAVVVPHCTHAPPHRSTKDSRRRTNEKTVDRRQTQTRPGSRVSERNTALLWDVSDFNVVCVVCGFVGCVGLQRCLCCVSSPLTRPAIRIARLPRRASCARPLLSP